MVRSRVHGEPVGSSSKDFELVLTQDDLKMLQRFYFISTDFKIKLSGPRGRVDCPLAGCLGVYEEALKFDLRFSLHPFVVKLLDRYALCLAQIASNSWHYIIGFMRLCSMHERRLTVNLF